MSRDSTLRIVSLLPDVLGTYSDSGNVTVLAKRAAWRGLPVEVVSVAVDAQPPIEADLYVLGGGEDAAQALAADWLRRHPRLCVALAERARTLAVCAGLQVLGRWMQSARGRRVAGAGVLDLTTTAGRRRAVGEVVSRCALPDVGLLTGFENHQGGTALGPGVPPLGRVLRGVGNGTPGDGTPGDGALGGGALGDGPHDAGAAPGEGVRTSRIVGTYLHGPVLARNPALADHLLSAVTGESLPPLELPDQEAVRRLRLDPPADAPAARRLVVRRLPRPLRRG